MNFFSYFSKIINDVEKFPEQSLLKESESLWCSPAYAACPGGLLAELVSKSSACFWMRIQLVFTVHWERSQIIHRCLYENTKTYDLKPPNTH